MEDMDTSESEHSDMDASDDDEWVQSEKKPIRRRASRSRSSSLEIYQSVTNDLENIKGCIDEVTEQIDGLCCTCSKQSSCKTLKCQCRANGNSCGQLCGCYSVKCSNREVESNMPNNVDSNEEKNLVAHGAMLLQNALESEKAAETNDDCATRRKALTDIGNTLVSFLVFI